jgi:hypothetical protein
MIGQLLHGFDIGVDQHGDTLHSRAGRVEFEQVSDTLWGDARKALELRSKQSKRCTFL